MKPVTCFVQSCEMIYKLMGIVKEKTLFLNNFFMILCIVSWSETLIQYRQKKVSVCAFFKLNGGHKEIIPAGQAFLFGCV